jgi:hypothetical protein
VNGSSPRGVVKVIPLQAVAIGANAGACVHSGPHDRSLWKVNQGPIIEIGDVPIARARVWERELRGRGAERLCIGKRSVICASAWALLSANCAFRRRPEAGPV